MRTDLVRESAQRRCHCGPSCCGPRGAAADIDAIGPIWERRGNRATLALLARAQAKARVSQPGDADEKAADRAADAAVRGPTPSPLEALGAARSGELGDGTRRRMEAHFGESFDDVRIHADHQAALDTRALDARALTIGTDIAFAPGHYQPGTTRGDWLIAHELAHVVQQRRTGEPMVHRDKLDEPFGDLTCTTSEVVAGVPSGASCCPEKTLEQGKQYVNTSRDYLDRAINRVAAGARIDATVDSFFGPGMYRNRSTILANLQTTLATASSFNAKHTLLCRPLSSTSGCTGNEKALAAKDTNITICWDTGGIDGGWFTILHELFHVSGVGDLPTYGRATAEQRKSGEFEHYWSKDPSGSSVPSYQRFPTPFSLRNADSYAKLVETIGDPSWIEEPGSAAIYAPQPGFFLGSSLSRDLYIGGTLSLNPVGVGNFSFILPGVLGLGAPLIGTVPADDAAAKAMRGYLGGELGARAVTGIGPVAGIFDLAVGAGARFTRDESVEPALGFRGSAGLRFGSPGFGGSVDAEVIRILELLRAAKGDQDWIFGGGLRLHWGGSSSTPR